MGSERDRCSDGALYERIGEAAGEAVHSLPARAMRRHQQLGLEIVEGRNGRLDDRLEHRATEMEAADDGRNARLAREPLRVSHDIDDPGMTAAGKDHEAAIGKAHHDRLVVEDQRVGLPATVNVRFMS